MDHADRVSAFNQIKDKYLSSLSGLLWKLSGNRELFEEAMQYALIGIFEHAHKLNGGGAHSYIYRIALSANSKAWRNRIGKLQELLPDNPALIGNPEVTPELKELMVNVRVCYS